MVWLLEFIGAVILVIVVMAGVIKLWDVLEKRNENSK